MFAPRGKLKRQNPYRWPCAVAMRRGEARQGLSMVPGVVYAPPYRLIENGKKLGKAEQKNERSTLTSQTY